MIAAFAALALAACFGPPQPVVVQGYADHAMEPFLSRDGRALFFNNRNEPADGTDLHWAERIDNVTFRYRGPLVSANSNTLDGVPSLAMDGTFSMTSLRAFEAQGATIWTGRWNGQTISNLSLQTALAPGRPPLFNMDGELSASGARFYMSDNRWGLIGGLQSSDLRVAVREDGRWRRAPEFDHWFAAINAASGLEYAPATSQDETELYFTRLHRPFLRQPIFEIWVAVRASANEAFGSPERIQAFQGIIEAPTVAPDGALYVHGMIDGRFQILRSQRACP